jgi:IS4 transposase
VLDSEERELLMTSVAQTKATKEDIAQLYTHRWQLEECYKKLKVCMEIENFSGNNLE